MQANTTHAWCTRACGVTRGQKLWLPFAASQLEYEYVRTLTSTHTITHALCIPAAGCRALLREVDHILMGLRKGEGRQRPCSCCFVL